MTSDRAKRDSEKLLEAVGSISEENDLPYFPGPIHIADKLKEKFHFKTIPEIGTDQEIVYHYNGQIFERADEIIKEESQKEFINQWKEMLTLIDNDKQYEKLKNRIFYALNYGPITPQINEVFNTIRRTTFTHDIMNPNGYIPFLNGLLNLKTRELEPFTHELFFTYQIEANLLIQPYITLKDTPLFAKLLNTAFYEPDIPTVLSYFAYAFYPAFPVHKVLFILGRERIGKGTIVRVLQSLMKKGSGSVSLARLLTAERFQFSGIEGKNLLVDSEVKRKFRRGITLDWSQFCNLFGGDTLSNELKGRESHDYVSSAKGIFLGNLPFMTVDNAPAIARLIIVGTRNERPTRLISELDKKIIGSERDQIATLLMEILFKLIDRDFDFPGQMTDEATAEVLDQMADPVQNFIEEESEFNAESSVTVEKAYSRFTKWCEKKGITIITRQTFAKKFGRTYPKKLLGPRGKRQYVFTKCILEDSDIDMNDQDILQVEHGNNLQGSLHNSVSGERYRRVQHASNNPSCMREKDDDYYIKDNTHKLNTDNYNNKSHENKAPSNTKGVINMQSNYAGSISERIKEKEPVPSLINTQHKNSRTYIYVALKDFSMYNHDYKAGIEFEHLQFFEEYVKNGTLKVIDGSKYSSSSTYTSENVITEAQGMEFIEFLLGREFHVIKRDSGVSFDHTEYKIAVVPPHEPQKKEQLLKIMSLNGFKLVSTGDLGRFFFVKLLVKKSMENKSF